MRCLFLVAESGKLDELQDLRLRFDPLALKVPPHITVVFPFDLTIPRQVMEGLMASVRSHLPIRFTLGVPKVMGESMVFPTALGSHDLIALHDRLHSGLPDLLRPAGPYLPHITYGRALESDAGRIGLELGRSLLPVHGVARRLVLERIGDNDASILEYEVASH